MSLREEARGRHCTIRLPGCNGNSETTVLAHFTGSRYRGIGQKPSDLLGAWSCSECHDRVDQRKKTPYLTRAEVQLAHAQGVFETLQQLEREEKIKYVKGS